MLPRAYIPAHIYPGNPYGREWSPEICFSKPSTLQKHKPALFFLLINLPLLLSILGSQGPPFHEKCTLLHPRTSPPMFHPQACLSFLVYVLRSTHQCGQLLLASPPCQEEDSTSSLPPVLLASHLHSSSWGKISCCPDP